MDQTEEAGLEEVCIPLSGWCGACPPAYTAWAVVLIVVFELNTAFEICSLAGDWEDRGRRDYQARDQRHASVHRGIDRVSLGSDRLVFLSLSSAYHRASMLDGFYQQRSFECLSLDASFSRTRLAPEC